MIISAKIESLSANFELNFTTHTWTLPPASARWGHVMYSDRGLFEVMPNGVMYLLDAMGSGKKECTVILHSAPTCESDTVHSGGGGRAYAPAAGAYRDKVIEWRSLRPSSSPELAVGRSSGGSTPVRLKAKQIAESLLPKAGKLTNGQPAANAKGTGCGEFPGRVLRRMPVLAPPQLGYFQITAGGDSLTLTSPTTHWEEMAKAIDAKYNQAKKTWVPFTGSNRPRTGDIYLLSQFEKKSEFQHVGMIISAEGNKWVTADGGQGNGWQSGFITREFHLDGQIDGEKGNKARLKGWVDLDNLREVLAKYFPANL